MPPLFVAASGCTLLLQMIFSKQIVLRVWWFLFFYAHPRTAPVIDDAASSAGDLIAQRIRRTVGDFADHGDEFVSFERFTEPSAFQRFRIVWPVDSRRLLCGR